MTDFRAVIVDDEQHCIDVLKYELEKTETKFSKIISTTSSEKAVNIIKQAEPDLVFLDIDMPVYSGFDVLAQFDTLDFEVIVTTAFEHYAIPAIKASAIDYLLKPVSSQELSAALNHFAQKRQNLINLPFDEIKNQLKEIQNGTFSKVAFPVKNGYKFIALENIIACEADGDYTNIILKNEAPLLISKNIGFIENLLPSTVFFRIHRKYLININKITQYSRADGGFLTLSNNKNYSIARSKHQMIEKLFLKG